MVSNTMFQRGKMENLKDIKSFQAMFSQVKPEVHLYQTYLECFLKCRVLGSVLNILNWHV